MRVINVKDVILSKDQTALHVEHGIVQYDISDKLIIKSGSRSWKVSLQSIKHRRLADVDPWIIKFHINPHCRSYGSLFQLLGGSGGISEVDIVTLILFKVVDEIKVKEKDNGVIDKDVKRSEVRGNGGEVTPVRKGHARKKKVSSGNKQKTVRS